jgi:hypothetical protein
MPIASRVIVLPSAGCLDKPFGSDWIAILLQELDHHFVKGTES